LSIATIVTGNFIATALAGSNRHAANTSGAAAAAAKIGSNVVHYPTTTTDDRGEQHLQA